MTADKTRLDQALVKAALVRTRSQAESYIKLGKVSVDGKIIKKAGYQTDADSKITIDVKEQFVSRAGLKLASANEKFNLDFSDKTVLDVGSSTGGFTDYALKHGAKKVIGVDVGSDQMHPDLSSDVRVELHEKTDIRDFKPASDQPISVVVIDVSFLSMRKVLPHVHSLCDQNTRVIAMLKPQFEGGQETRHRGVIKNSRVRRQIIMDFEKWVKQYFVIRDSIDSQVSGSKGNVERFYLLAQKA